VQVVFFGCLDAEATLITIATKKNLRLREEVTLERSHLWRPIHLLWKFIVRPPLYIGPLGAGPHLTSPDGGLFAQSDPTTQQVYMADHTSTGYSPLHQAVNHRVHRISLSSSPAFHRVHCISFTLAATADHKSWQSRLYYDTLDQLQARPRHQPVLFMGILRAVWDHRASDADSRLILLFPDFSLVQSLCACPASFSGEVTELLHETVRMLLSSSTSRLVHTRPTPALQGSYTSADQGKCGKSARFTTP